MTAPDSKEIWNAWLVRASSATETAAIRILIMDYGYTPRGAAAVLRWAYGRHGRI